MQQEVSTLHVFRLRCKVLILLHALPNVRVMFDLSKQTKPSAFPLADTAESHEGTVRRSLQLQTEQPLPWPQMSFCKPLSLFSASLCCSEWLGSIGTMPCPVPPQQLKVSGDTLALLSIEKPENLCNHIRICSSLFTCALEFLL